MSGAKKDTAGESKSPSGRPSGRPSVRPAVRPAVRELSLPRGSHGASSVTVIANVDAADQWEIGDEVNWKRELSRVFLSRKTLAIVMGMVSMLALRVAIDHFIGDSIVAAVPRVRIIHAVSLALDPSISLPGNIEAIEQAGLYSHVGGYLKQIFVDEGDRVKRGQVLAEIDAPDVMSEYNRISSVMRLRRITRDRNRDLLLGEVISQQEYDTISAAYDEALARYQNAKENVGYTKIRAEFDGSIARRGRYPGDLISASDKVPIFVLVNEAKLRLVLNVPQVDVAAVKQGNAVDICFDAFPGEIFHGSITRLDAMLDPQTKTQRVLVDLNNKAGKLHAGMFANVKLHLDHAGPALTLPSDVIMDATPETGFVWLDVDGKAKKISVSLGPKLGDLYEISAGLKESDAVVLAGISDLTDAQAISPLP